MPVYHETGTTATIIDLASYRRLASEASQQDREKDRETNRKIASELASSAGARAHAREGDGNSAAIKPVTGDELRGYYAMDEVYAYYCDVYDRQRVAPSVRRDIAAAIDGGMEPAVIMAAMDAAAQAAAPSWAYARAVIVRCLSEGVLTLDAYDKRTEAHRASYQARPGRGYAERQVTEDDFEHGFYVDVMARRGRGGKNGDT